MKRFDPSLGLTFAEVVKLSPAEYRRFKALQKAHAADYKAEREQARKGQIDTPILSQEAALRTFYDDPEPLTNADVFSLTDADWALQEELRRAQVQEAKRAKQEERAARMAARVAKRKPKEPEHVVAEWHEEMQRARDARMAKFRAEYLEDEVL